MYGRVRTICSRFFENHVHSIMMELYSHRRPATSGAWPCTALERIATPAWCPRAGRAGPPMLADDLGHHLSCMQAAADERLRAWRRRVLHSCTGRAWRGCGGRREREAGRPSGAERAHGHGCSSSLAAAAACIYLSMCRYRHRSEERCCEHSVAGSPVCLNADITLAKLHPPA